MKADRATLEKLFSYPLDGWGCIEVEFEVTDMSGYENCWMGKMPDPEHQEQELFWFGLKPDGTEAWDYHSLFDFMSAPIFKGKTLCEISEKINVLSVDGTDPAERMRFYLYDRKDPIRFA